MRQTFLHRARETPVAVTIECLDAQGPPPPLDPARVPGQLMGAAMYAIGCAQLVRRLGARHAASTRP